MWSRHTPFVLQQPISNLSIFEQSSRMLSPVVMFICISMINADKHYTSRMKLVISASSHQIEIVYIYEKLYIASDSFYIYFNKCKDYSSSINKK